MNPNIAFCRGIWLALTGLLSLPLWLSANHIQVNNVRLKATNFGAQHTQVTFDLSWENSWRLSTGAANWDAAWVFVKYRTHNDVWRHASLNYVNGTAAADGHVEVPGSTITTPSDGVGAFIYRAGDGTGHVSWAGLQLRWNYGADGVQNNDLLEVQVFAIEMVYVPQGNYLLGGGFGGEVGKLVEWTGPLNFTTPYSVNSEAAISVGTSTGNLFYLSPGTHNAGDQLGPIPAQFPKGFQGFYCMKYEVTQEQWLDFFNLLTPTQQSNNDLTDLDHKGPNPIDRNSIEWEGTGGATTANPWVPVSFPLWGETLAYLDWAGLRPMTELEFVKACRGNGPVVANGYAWGNSNIIPTNFTYDLYHENEIDATVNAMGNIGNANWIHSSIFEDGPYRNGIFAASAWGSERQEVGATYYGIMEMSGNLSEMCITIGTPQGRAFRGRHGDGTIDASGEADVPFWPPISGEGGGLFGGAWFSQAEELQINDRRSATVGNVGYFNDVGFRGVRTSP